MAAPQTPPHEPFTLDVLFTLSPMTDSVDGEHDDDDDDDDVMDEPVLRRSERPKRKRVEQPVSPSSKHIPKRQRNRVTVPTATDKVFDCLKKVNCLLTSLPHV
jgi:hypothetical protein